jgi:hypothetical protein
MASISVVVRVEGGALEVQNLEKRALELRT